MLLTAHHQDDCGVSGVISSEVFAFSWSSSCAREPAGGSGWEAPARALNTFLFAVFIELDSSKWRPLQTRRTQGWNRTKRQ
jgi:hypothetical protein